MKFDFERPLVAYAYLAQSGAQNDILGGLIPLIAPIAKDKAEQIVDADHLRNELGRLYGIDVHPWAMEELMPRLVRAKIVTERQMGKSRRCVHYYAENHEVAVDGMSERSIQDILDDVSQFADTIMSKSGFTLEHEYIQKHFMNQLVTSDFQVRLISPAHKAASDSKILTLPSRTIEPAEAHEPDLSAEAENTNRVKIIGAAYVFHAYHHRPDVYQKLLNIASGAIIAEYVLNLREPGENVQLNGLKLYLDGPLAMSYLDLSEIIAAKHITLLLEKLKEKGAQLCIFREHVDEIQDNLRAALAVQGGDINGRPRVTHRRMYSSSSFRSYVQAVHSDVETALGRKGIVVVRHPEQGITYFSDDLVTQLTSGLGSYSAQARYRDARAISGIVRQRAGRITSRSNFHDCRHIFVTENRRVSSVATDFVIRNCDYRQSYVPPVITDRYLAGLMLVLYGGTSSAEVSHEKLLANCASALEPNHELLTRVTSFLKDVGGDRADAFIDMMTNSRASQHQAVYLLNDNVAIRNLADAERAFVDFESEIEDSLKTRYEAEMLESQRAYQLELAQAQADKDRLTHHAKQSDDHFQGQIGALQGSLDNAHAEAEIIRGQMLAQVQQKLQGEQNDLEDLLMVARHTVQLRRKVIVSVIATLGFLLGVVANYLSFGVDSFIQKALCAVSLVALPSVFSWLSSSALKAGDTRKTEVVFRNLLKQRRNLEQVSYDYELDFKTGKATRVAAPNPAGASADVNAVSAA